MHSIPLPGSRDGSARGLSTVVGTVIIIVVVFASVLVIAGLGSAALSDTQHESALDRAEHTMTLLDSRTAMVALGNSDTQTLSFGQDGGTVETRPDEGRLVIDHINYTTGETETIYKEDLGSVVYSNGDTLIAYQGGGVWRLDGAGDAQMLSPPEFHYRGATLTLPVVRIAGDQESATSPLTRVSDIGEAQLIYPNATTGSQNGTGAPYDVTEAPYDNPIRNGTVAIRIQSPYYKGWAEYARQRTTADVTVNDSNETVRLVLQSIGGSLGDFEMPLEGDSLEVSGIAEGHPINDFSLTLAADGNFQNGHWSLYSNDNGDEFEMHIHTKGKCTGGGSYNDVVDFSIYYYKASTGEVREWQNDSITPGPGTAIQINCSTQELDIDFTNNDTKLTYTDIDLTGSDNKWCFGSHIADRDVPENITLNQHPVDGSKWFNESKGDAASMNFTVNHYISRMGPKYDLTVKDGPGNSECQSPGNGKGSSRVDESLSAGRFTFEETSGAKYITYLHVTENRVGIELN